MRGTVRSAGLLICAGMLAACSAAPAHHTRPAASAAPATAGSRAPAAAFTGQRGPLGSGRAVTFAFAGDTQFPDIQDTDPGVTSTGLPVLADQLRADPTHVLDPVAPYFRDADLAMVNVETALTDHGSPVSGKRYHFRSPPATLLAVKAAGVDVVNMANNHALDYGPSGMQDTFAAIRAAGLPVLGIGHNAAEAFRPYRTVIKGQRIGILSGVDWLEPALVPAWTATDTQPGLAFTIDRTRILAAVRALRPQVDTLVVFLHWGVEGTWCASPEQQDLVRLLTAAGADVIVGSHAHRVFGAGRLGKVFVAYGMGNFVYFREDGESGRSGILRVTVTGRHTDSYSWVPARIHHGIAIPQTGAAAAADLATWEQRRACSGLTK